MAPSFPCNPSVSPRKAPRNEELECQPRVVPQPQNPPERECRRHRERAALQRRVNRDRSIFCLWANWPRRSKATTPDSLWASGWGAPEPGCARSEATTAARRWREAERSDAVMFPSETPTAAPWPHRGRTAAAPWKSGASAPRKPRPLDVLSLGKLAKKEQSDDAGQFVGKRVGRARAGMCEERSDDRSPPMARSRTQRCRDVSLRNPNCRTAAGPWKSGASAPRKPHRIDPGLQPSGSRDKTKRAAQRRPVLIFLKAES